MAERKPTFISSEGFSQEMAQTDSITLGGLTIDATGTGIDMNSTKVTDMGSATTAGDALAYGQSGASLAGLSLTGALAMGTNKITGLGDGTNPQDAVTKSQLDAAVINGGTIKELLFDQSQLNDTDGIYALEVISFEAQPVAGDTIVLSDGTTTVTMTAVANQGAESAETDFSIETDAATAMQRLVTRFNAATANTKWDMTFRATEHPDVNANGVIVVTENFTAAGDSTSRVYGTWTTQANCTVIEYAAGGTVDLDYSDETEVTLPSSDPAEGRFGLRRQQAALVANEIHFVRTNDTQYAWDDDDSTWQVLSGPASIPDATAASGGGVKGKITVDSDYGLSVTTGVLQVNVESDGAIVFDSTNKGLEVNIEATNPSLQISSNELGVKLGDGITKDTNGLTVDLYATNATLEFTGASPNGELGVKQGNGITSDANGLTIDLESSNPSLQLSGTSPNQELGVKLGDGITKDTNGLRVDLTASGGLELTGTSPNQTLGVNANGNAAIEVGASGVGVIVDAAGAIVFDGTSGGLEVNLEASNPSLQISSNQLGVKLDGTQGAAKGANGVYVKVDGTTISYDGSGNLQSIGSDESTRLENTLTTATDATSNGDPVYANGNDTVGKADASVDAKSRVLGVIRTGAGAAGSTPEVVSAGPCAGVLSGATFNTPYYLLSGGGIGTTAPTGNNRVIMVGYAINATDLFVRITDYGKRAA